MAVKKPSILEGEIARALGRADKLKIMNVKGSAGYWVPEDTVNTKTKHITENGTYLPKDDDCYGYSEVTVNVPKNKITGEDADGDDYTVEVDDDGNIKKTKVPSAIRIVRPPARTNYESGETISFGGLAVVMLDKHGLVFEDAEHPNGVLSHDELEFPVTTASGSTWYEAGSGLYWTADSAFIAKSEGEYLGTTYSKWGTRTFTKASNGPCIAAFVRNFPPRAGVNPDGYAGLVTLSPIAGHTAFIYNGGRVYSANGSAVYDGVSVSYNSSLVIGETQGPPNYSCGTPFPQIGSTEDALAICRAANLRFSDSPEGGNEIPVNWDTGSYNLDKTFSDSFTINVSSSSSSSSSEDSGSSSDSGDSGG